MRTHKKIFHGKVGAVFQGATSLSGTRKNPAAQKGAWKSLQKKTFPVFLPKKNVNSPQLWGFLLGVTAKVS